MLRLLKAIRKAVYKFTCGNENRLYNVYKDRIAGMTDQQIINELSDTTIFLRGMKPHNRKRWADLQAEKLYTIEYPCSQKCSTL